jgi:hypothetical protein
MTRLRFLWSWPQARVLLRWLQRFANHAPNCFGKHPTIVGTRDELIDGTSDTDVIIALKTLRLRVCPVTAAGTENPVSGDRSLYASSSRVGGRLARILLDAVLDPAFSIRRSNAFCYRSRGSSGLERDLVVLVLFCRRTFASFLVLFQGFVLAATPSVMPDQIYGRDDSDEEADDVVLEDVSIPNGFALTPPKTGPAVSPSTLAGENVVWGCERLTTGLTRVGAVWRQPSLINIELVTNVTDAKRVPCVISCRSLCYGRGDIAGQNDDATLDVYVDVFVLRVDILP